MSNYERWSWLSPATVGKLTIACEVGAGADEHTRFNEMRAVAHVIHNRMDSSEFLHTTVQEVTLAPRQFSCVGDSRWNGLLAGEKTKRYPRYWPPIMEAARLAWGSVEWERKHDLDPVRGATFYFSPVSMPATRQGRGTTVEDWLKPDALPEGWPEELVEVTPDFIDSTRFRFYAFPDDLKPEPDYVDEANARSIEGLAIDFVDLDEDDLGISDLGAMNQRRVTEPSPGRRADGVRGVDFDG